MAYLNSVAGEVRAEFAQKEFRKGAGSDAGRGFAVVADEVKDMAEQSRQATGQVQRILEDLRQAAGRVARLRRWRKPLSAARMAP